MDIRVYEITNKGIGKCLGIFDDYASFNFTKSFKKMGSFTIKGLLTDNNKKLLAPDRIIYINSQISGIIHSVDYTTNETGGIEYTAYGNDMKVMLSYRYNKNTYNKYNCEITKYINDLVYYETGGYIREAKFPDEWYLAHDTLFDVIKRSLPFTSDKIDKQVSYTTLLKTVEEVIADRETNHHLPLGYDVTLSFKDDKPITTFSLLEGKDRTSKSANPYILSRDFDNVQSITRTVSNKDFYDWVTVGGDGEGKDRFIYTVSNCAPYGENERLGISYRHKFVDARHLQRTYKDNQEKEHTLSIQDYGKIVANHGRQYLEQSIDAIAVEPAHVDMNTALSLLGSKVSIIDKELDINTTDYVSSINIIDEQDGLYTELTIGTDIETGGTL